MKRDSNTEEKMDVSNAGGTELPEDNRNREENCCNEDNCCNEESNGADSSREDSCSSEDKSSNEGNSGNEDNSGNKDKCPKCDEYFQMLQRTAAEFDNYKKRTLREKEAIYIDALGDTVKAFLPVIDSVERAVRSCSEQADVESLRKGIELIHRQIKDVLKELGVEEIKGQGENFDPVLHNAVMHVEDEAYGHNVIVEEFQKGYIYKDRVIRYSMVKVAN